MRPRRDGRPGSDFFSFLVGWEAGRVVECGSDDVLATYDTCGGLRVLRCVGWFVGLGKEDLT